MPSRPRLPAPDRRYVLLSTNSPGHRAFQSDDLYRWTAVNATGPDAGLNVAIGEGPHVLDWQGFRWLNSEPGDQHKQLSRSSDGGHSWTHLPEPWVTPMAQGTRELDVGTPHQGPISLQGVRGDTPFYLYFTHVPLDPACVDCRRVRTSIATWYSWSIKLRAPF